MNIVSGLIVGKLYGFQFEAIKVIVESKITGFGQAFAYELGAVIQPGGKDGGFLVRILLFQKAKNTPVMVVRIFDAVSPNVVFIRPGAGEQTVVAYGGNGGSFGVSVFATPHVRWV